MANKINHSGTILYHVSRLSQLDVVIDNTGRTVLWTGTYKVSIHTTRY